mgnify:CR=1 FL=1|tara:strand:- start:3029 stop:4414 length:1386 start_codon:yes stop_codon:yes gene_type:complete
MDKEKFRSFEDLYGIKDTSPKKPANFQEKARRFADDLLDDAQYYSQKFNQRTQDFLLDADIPIETKQALDIVKAYRQLGGSSVNIIPEEIQATPNNRGRRLGDTPLSSIKKHQRGKKRLLEEVTKRQPNITSAELDIISSNFNPIDMELGAIKDLKTDYYPSLPFLQSAFTPDIDIKDPKGNYMSRNKGTVFSAPLGVTKRTIDPSSKLFDDPSIPLDLPAGYLYGSTTLAHELGHALDYSTPRGKKLINKRSPAETQEIRKKFKVGGGSPTGALVAGLGVFNPDQSLRGQMIEGAISELVSPEWRNILESEARADLLGRKIAKKAGTPWSLKSQLSARGTYGAYPLAKGAVSVIPGYVLNAAADFGMDVLEHGVIDPLARKMIGGDTNFESSLRQYGYDPSKYNIEPTRTVDAPLQNVPIVGPILDSIAPFITEIGGREEIPITRVRGLPGVLRNIAMPK